MDAHTHGFIRLSFSSALRNPTLADQYLFLDVGPATLVGNLNGAQDLVTVSSFIDYRNSSLGSNIGFNLDTLVYFDIAPLQPEQVRTVRQATAPRWEKSYTSTPTITSVGTQISLATT